MSNESQKSLVIENIDFLDYITDSNTIERLLKSNKFLTVCPEEILTTLIESNMQNENFCLSIIDIDAFISSCPQDLLEKIIGTHSTNTDLILVLLNKSVFVERCTYSILDTFLGINNSQINSKLSADLFYQLNNNLSF